MTLSPIRKIYEEFSSAIIWAESIIREVPSHWRAYHFRDLLLKEMEDFESGQQTSQIDEEVLLPLMEANLYASFLRELHSKYRGRMDRAFLVSLRAHMYGPRYAIDELTGTQNKKVGSYGRDIESELLFASRVKDSSIVTFEGHDVVYHMDDYKFGVEIKRIHSDERITSQFIKACQQIQNDRNIRYGWVVFRFDKWTYVDKRGQLFLPKPLLERRTNTPLKAESEAHLSDLCRFQTKAFYEEFGQTLGQMAADKDFDKVAGFGAFINLPYLVGNPGQIFNSGQAVFNMWNNGDEERNKANQRMKEQLEFMAT